MNNIKLVLVRHGESEWNKENRFTGWMDIDLSNEGRIESVDAGRLLKNAGFVFDYGYTSMLKRAIHTLWIILDQIDQAWLPIKKSWRLNERHYGALQGLNKDEAIKKYGYDIVQKWRRSFDMSPPKNYKNNQYIGTNDTRYNSVKTNELPNGENLSSTLTRIMPYWINTIVPCMKKNKSIIIVAHGNSIRAIIKFLDQLSTTEIFDLNLPTGKPLIYELNQNIRPIQHYYL